ncbi:prepilin-type N-terminal cleavage/methylation domain-containing protein [Pseudomonas resinovorans]|nr:MULTISPECIES: prepilin-type N-terminal cleavage/methylation domain-containing protein [Pseudomonas]MDE3738023.1 prepilin-type N-terminal cleavage/methylation domain-containing protein [Pseudomonas resinovorans]
MGSLVVTGWMPMLATCRSADRVRGFTLLELLVVLAVVAAIAAVVLPGLANMQSAWSRRVALQDIQEQLQSLGLRVRNDGRELTIDADGASRAEMLQVPTGWLIVAEPPVRYLANGVCLGGSLRIIHDGLPRDVRLDPPFCAPQGLP